MSPPIEATARPSLPTARDLTHDLWDVIVIGAGPSGAVSAIQLATAGRKVLLIDSKKFPRDKVCGGCLNQRAWLALEQIKGPHQSESAADRIRSAGAMVINRLRLSCLASDVNWSLPPLHAISRHTMDEVLVNLAEEAGVTFCPGTTARVINDDATNYRSVAISGIDLQAAVLKTNHAKAGTLKAKIVIAADGLGHSSLNDLPAFHSCVAKDARVGLGTLVLDNSETFAPHELTMAVGRCGYVGLTRVEHGKLNVAAAIDAAIIKQHGPIRAVDDILTSCHLPVLDSLHVAKWTGTLPLTRHSQTVASRRLFLVGDAAGYIEPFTGEGMSWAILSAMHLCHLLNTAGWDDCDQLSRSWISQWRKQVRRKQFLCRVLAELLRRPSLAGYTLHLASAIPWIPQWLITHASGTSPTNRCPGAA
jgi:menaquinone-9 beta-reductase